MKRVIEVRARYKDGRTATGVGVTIQVHQTLAGCFYRESTNASGAAYFDLDTDQFAKITIMAGKATHFDRVPISGLFHIIV